MGVLYAAGMLATMAMAQGPKGEPPEHRGPPPEALAPCKAAKAGVACSFTDREGRALTGTCFAPEGKPLACRPQGAPPPPDAGASAPRQRPQR